MLYVIQHIPVIMLIIAALYTTNCEAPNEVILTGHQRPPPHLHHAPLTALTPGVYKPNTQKKKDSNPRPSTTPPLTPK
jgi:hypothetical protein